MPRTLVGKIARLPENLREQLNHRLLDNHPAFDILPWLNDLAPVREILAAQFKGAPINHQNLDNWRKSGFQRWFDARQSITETKELAQFSANLTAAGNGSIPLGASAIASGQILKRLHRIACDENENGASADLLKLTSANAILLKGEQNHDRIKIARERLGQHYMGLRLKRDKQQRTDAAVALRVLGDARAKAIEAAPGAMPKKSKASASTSSAPSGNLAPFPRPGRHPQPAPLRHQPLKARQG
jgi:hypothetical protein